jgi:hypothetical protein
MSANCELSDYARAYPEDLFWFFLSEEQVAALSEEDREEWRRAVCRVRYTYFFTPAVRKLLDQLQGDLNLSIGPVITPPRMRPTAPPEEPPSHGPFIGENFLMQMLFASGREVGARVLEEHIAAKIQLREALVQSTKTLELEIARLERIQNVNEHQ